MIFERQTFLLEETTDDPLSVNVEKSNVNEFSVYNAPYRD